jgi:peptidoglycan/xylan/chitin deacetylase (PgdA/CDA1 family)/uncharacterized membrane protein YbhN (UPF0104 family)
MAIVPVAVKVRVALAVTAGAVASAAPLALGRALAHPAAGAVTSGMLLLALAYVGWCWWPRWRWPIPRRLLASLDGDAVTLSFDDGPTPGVTGELLDLLRASGRRATFFVLTAKARAHAPLIRRIVDEGHRLGLHGEDHRSPFFRSARDLAQSLSRARAELEAIAGAPVTLYRPSHGHKTVALVRAVAQAGLELCFWDVGVWDTDAPPVEVLLGRLDQVRARAGRTVLLLHDGRGDEPGVPAHAPVMLESLRRWLPTLSAGEESSTEASPGPGPGSLQYPLPAADRSALSILFGVVVSGLFVWTLRALDLGALRAAIAHIPVENLLLAAAAALAATVLQGLRFRLLFPAGSSPLRHIGLTFALHTGNILLPFRGGELLRPLYLKRQDPRLPVRALIGYTIADKAIEIVCLVPFLLYACHVFATDERFASLRRFAWPVGLGAAAVLCVVAIHQLRRAGTASAILPLAGSLALSLGVWAMNWLIFYSVVPDARLSLALIVGVNASLALPGLPAGLGTYEAAFVWVGAMGGWSGERLLAAAIASHAVQILGTLAIGVPLITRWGWPGRGAIARAAEATAR